MTITGWEVLLTHTRDAHEHMRAYMEIPTAPQKWCRKAAIVNTATNGQRLAGTDVNTNIAMYNLLTQIELRMLIRV